jgi:hypothetical protein
MSIPNQQDDFAHPLDILEFMEEIQEDVECERIFSLVF